jgi:hypothetical protein
VIFIKINKQYLIIISILGIILITGITAYYEETQIINETFNLIDRCNNYLIETIQKNMELKSNQTNITTNTETNITTGTETNNNNYATFTFNIPDDVKCYGISMDVLYGDDDEGVHYAMWKNPYYYPISTDSTIKIPYYYSGLKFHHLSYFRIDYYKKNGEFWSIDPVPLSTVEDWMLYVLKDETIKVNGGYNVPYWDEGTGHNWFSKTPP